MTPTTPNPSRPVDWYLAHGVDETAARYFANGPRRIIAVAPAPGYALLLDFDNGERRRLDCTPYFNPGSAFEALRDPAAFARVFLDESGNPAWDIDPAVDSSVHWNNRIDLCKDNCYLRSTPLAPPETP
jgi:hypothetical protein